MILVIGLGAIGANIGLRLAEQGHEVGGLEFDVARAREWAGQASSPAWTSFVDVPWSSVETVIIAVRLVDQLRSCMRDILEGSGTNPLSVFVVTTLAFSDARALLPTMPRQWRVLESPISGGPQAARAGTMTVFLAGPRPTELERAMLGELSSRVFETSGYGQPAMLKLLNNTLGAYNAISTAHMIGLAEKLGVDSAQFLSVVSASSGQSWMSDNFDNFHHELLFKDVRLLQQDVGDLPVVDFTETGTLDDFIESTRRQIEGQSS